MNTKLKSGKMNIDTLVILSVSIFSLLLWDSPIIQPIKIFVVLLHEISHAIAAIVTGGSVEKIILDFNLSGNTITKNGNQILIAFSGYIGSLIIGSSILISAKSKIINKWVSTIISIVIFIAAINLVQGGLQIFFSILISLFFFFLPRYAHEKFVKYSFMIIGLTSCFYIIADIKQDLLTTTLRETDTQLLEYLTGISAIAIGFFILLVSVITVGIIINKMYLAGSK